MKCVIVKASFIAREGRWDVEHYIGDGPRIDEDLVRARARLKHAKDAIARLTKESILGRKRQRKMIRDGDVIPVA